MTDGDLDMYALARKMRGERDTGRARERFDESVRRGVAQRLEQIASAIGNDLDPARVRALIRTETP